MSMMFRTMASVTRTLAQALTLSGIFVLVISIYTGFSVPRPYMEPWFEWLSVRCGSLLLRDMSLYLLLK